MQADPDAIGRGTVNGVLSAARTDSDRGVGGNCVADARLRADRGNNHRLAQTVNRGEEGPKTIGVDAVVIRQE
ncbi:hypothetical protein PX52LOC_05934 [Limnoglobus roseus]|uniref:Uncharacterized protein n=1 Tax=Limnoglobus roseus TaxID=2598579 RepID=A0A5C1AJ49_9BACT|nr:hypothetical protein PX52LOC_05934 [Limnoglobus roseus]